MKWNNSDIFVMKKALISVLSLAWQIHNHHYSVHVSTQSSRFFAIKDIYSRTQYFNLIISQITNLLILDYILRKYNLDQRMIAPYLDERPPLLLKSLGK